MDDYNNSRWNWVLTHRAEWVSLQVHAQVTAAFDAEDGDALPGFSLQ